MGITGRLRYPRTAAAVILLVVAVALPSGAWSILGGRQLSRQAELERKTLHSYAHKKGVVLAERLSARLAALRTHEAERPFYHYQKLYRDPEGVTHGTSLSPLAARTVNSYVQTYFQVDQEAA